MNNVAMLEFKNVTVDSTSSRITSISNVTFQLNAGEVAIVLLEEDRETLPLFDLAEGLAEPDDGTVAFKGEYWDRMSPWKAGEMRGRIGRVFDGEGWISNLSVYENIALSSRHHTSLPDSIIRKEAGELCEIVGLNCIPDVRPDLETTGILRRAEWVRALMGNPSLLLLERPERGAPLESISNLLQLVSHALEKQSAVLWTTLDGHIWTTKLPGAARRFRMQGREMIEAGEIT